MSNDIESDCRHFDSSYFARKCRKTEEVFIAELMNIKSIKYNADAPDIVFVSLPLLFDVKSFVETSHTNIDNFTYFRNYNYAR